MILFSIPVDLLPSPLSPPKRGRQAQAWVETLYFINEIFICHPPRKQVNDTPVQMLYKAGELQAKPPCNEPYTKACPINMLSLTSATTSRRSSLPTRTIPLPRRFIRPALPNR